MAFDADIIELYCRWQVSYRLSYWELAAIMAERGGLRFPYDCKPASALDADRRRNMLIRLARHAILLVNLQRRFTAWLSNEFPGRPWTPDSR